MSLNFNMDSGKDIVCNIADWYWWNIWNALRNLVPFIQFKKREKHPWRSVTFYYLLTLVFVLQWFSVQWEIMIMLLSVSIDFPSSGIHHLTTGFSLIFYWLRWPLWSFERCSLRGYLETRRFCCSCWIL